MNTYDFLKQYLSERIASYNRLSGTSFLTNGTRLYLSGVRPEVGASRRLCDYPEVIEELKHINALFDSLSFWQVLKIRRYIRKVSKQKHSQFNQSREQEALQFFSKGGKP